MPRSIGRLLLGAIALSAPMLFTSLAAADETGVAACGNIHVSAEAKCEAYVDPIECKGHCEPLSFEAACTGQCDGKCTASAEGSCTVECQGSCEAECNLNPGSFECSGRCEADCGATCQGHCASDANSAECEASCKSSCSGECKAQCSGTPPSADCKAKCQASCTGECNFQANIDCDIDCHASCTAELQGGCEVQCDDPKGAVFCDSQYVDAGNNLDDCVNALRAELGIEVTGYANAECSGNECTAEAGCSCGPSSIANAPVSETATATAFLAGLGLLVSRRRKRDRK